MDSIQQHCLWNYMKFVSMPLILWYVIHSESLRHSKPLSPGIYELVCFLFHSFSPQFSSCNFYISLNFFKKSLWKFLKVLEHISHSLHNSAGSFLKSTVFTNTYAFLCTVCHNIDIFQHILGLGNCPTKFTTKCELWSMAVFQFVDWFGK